MLYGMNEEKEDFEKDDYSLIKKEKINFKKVIVFIAVVFVCFLIIFGSFYISYKNIQKRENINFSETENASNESKKENIEKDKKTNKSNNKNKENYYEGNHVQIALHDTNEIVNKFVPEANPNAQNLIKDIYYSEEKQVYLTFDDGPSKDITPRILDVLKENDVKATFFVLGARVDLYPDTLKREYSEGHYIANHGYSHKYSQIYESKDTVFQEYIDCENSIKKALNNENYNTYLFRFPGGSSGGYYASIKSEARELLNSYGVAYTNWNCLTGDAEGKKTKESCITELINTKGNQNSLIVLMHDANDKQQTLDALPDIIQYFKNEGYTFKTFNEIF